jgi:hypothetical protein
MKTNTVKKLLAFVLVLVYVSLISSFVLATPPTVQATYDNTSTKVADIGGRILGIVTTFGMVVAVIMLVWLAIKYISASPDGKASIKDSSVIYVVGAIILFAASGIVKLISAYGSDIGSGLAT